MQKKNIHLSTIEMLLASITKTRGDDGARASFFFGKPGAPHWEQRMGTEIYYHFAELDLAALHVRSVGPAYLKALSLEDIRDKLQNFLKDNFWYVANTAFFKFDERPFNDWVPDEEKLQLAEALRNSTIFQPVNDLTVFPLVAVAVDDSFVSDQFFFSSTAQDDAFYLRDQNLDREFDPSRFPPSKDFKGKINYPNSWLGSGPIDFRRVA